jgi:hypothetical protein
VSFDYRWQQIYARGLALGKRSAGLFPGFSEPLISKTYRSERIVVMLAQIIWKLTDFLLFRKGTACGSSYTFGVVFFDPSFPHGKGKAEPRVLYRFDADSCAQQAVTNKRSKMKLSLRNGVETMRAVAFLGLTLALAPLAANATVVELVKILDKGAFASWQYSDALGNQVFVSVVTSVVTFKPGNQNPLPSLSVSIFKTTPDGGVVLASGTGFTDQFLFTEDNQLSTAHVAGTLDVVDELNGSTFTFTVDLTWTATGDLITERSKNTFIDNGFKHIMRFRGEHRDARAVGSVVGNGLQWTPVPSTEAQIQKNVEGDLTIEVKHPR